MNEDELKTFAEEAFDTPAPTLTLDPFPEEKRRSSQWKKRKRRLPY